MYERACAYVDLNAIKKNIDNMKKSLPKDTKFLAVLKADGYGHGASMIAKKLEEDGNVSYYATATVPEALELRSAGCKKPILILGHSFPEDYESMVREEITPAIFQTDCMDGLAKEAARQKKKAKVHIKVDTGMNRIGISPDEAGLEFVKKVMSHPELEPEGIFTHFATADEENLIRAYRQYRKFADFINLIEKETGYVFPLKHCANSAAIMQMKDTAMNMVRAGIAMYGIMPSKETKLDYKLYPAMEIKSHIVFLKTLNPGEEISYGGKYTTQKIIKVATIPIGYADGYPRSLSDIGYVLIRGKKAPIVGRICMDQFMVDVTEIHDVCEGDEVTIIGKDGSESISMEALGELSGRFHYELSCDWNRRIQRIYKSFS